MCQAGHKTPHYLSVSTAQNYDLCHSKKTFGSSTLQFSARDTGHLLEAQSLKWRSQGVDCTAEVGPYGEGRRLTWLRHILGPWLMADYQQKLWTNSMKQKQKRPRMNWTDTLWQALKGIGLTWKEAQQLSVKWDDLCWSQQLKNPSALRQPELVEKSKTHWATHTHWATAQCVFDMGRTKTTDNSSKIKYLSVAVILVLNTATASLFYQVTLSLSLHSTSLLAYH